MIHRRLLALAGVLALALGSPARASDLTGDAHRAARAREAILELDYPVARVVLEGVDAADQIVAIERARLALYEGDCDAAAAILSRPDLAAGPQGAELGVIAQGCAQATAGTMIVRDDERGVLVRLQDDEDRALVPILADVAAKARETLAKELGVVLPSPLRIDLVRDHYTLAAMTGLPVEAARTTGTVAVAKWGRVTMISPRSTPHGYPWLDTLAHEMTHLALSRGTRDKAPLWLQEGVAKREETRWREKQPLDDFPSADATAALGIEKGLGRPLDKIGPSIAMLPSSEEASVVFAQVASFIRFWSREVGEDALPQLVLRLKAADEHADVDKAITEVSGADFATWDKRWRAYLATVPRDIPPELAPGAAVPNVREIAKRVRLGQLLQGRGHSAEAAVEHARAHALIPHEASVRCWLAESLLATGDKANAAPLVQRVEELHDRVGRWWSLHGLLFADDAVRSFDLGVAHDPLDASVACEEKASPELPNDPIRAALCEAARRVPR